MTASYTISTLLGGPLDPNWTVATLAEELLGAVASSAGRDFVLEVDDATDRQTRRLIRPLLAYLATKSADETGAPVNLYGGRLCFKLPGPVWVLGEFENQTGRVRLAVRRSDSPAEMPQIDASKSSQTQETPVVHEAL